LIPKDNEKDLTDIPDNVKRGLKIIPISTIDELLLNALVTPPQPIEWSEPDEAAAIAARVSDQKEEVIRH
jgi:ATP-dependent Lon protease